MPYRNQESWESRRMHNFCRHPHDPDYYDMDTANEWLSEVYAQYLQDNGLDEYHFTASELAIINDIDSYDWSDITEEDVIDRMDAIRYENGEFDDDE